MSKKMLTAYEVSTLIKLSDLSNQLILSSSEFAQEIAKNFESENHCNMNEESWNELLISTKNLITDTLKIYDLTYFK